MVEILLDDLQHQLQSMPERTSQETIIAQKCFFGSIKQCTLGTVAASGLTWIATRRLGSIFQRSLSVGAGAIAGYWSLKSAVYSSVEQILTLEGTRIQLELATGLMEVYPHNTKAIQLISKHFYLEKLYDDSTSDNPKLRWRYRTSWLDNNANSQSTQDKEYQSDSDSDNQMSDNNQSDTEAKQVPMKSATVLMADPFDCIFGHSTTNEESSHSDTNTVPPTVMNGKHKRSRRRRRRQRQHESQSMKTRGQP